MNTFTVTSRANHQPRHAIRRLFRRDNMDNHILAIQMACRNMG